VTRLGTTFSLFVNGVVVSQASNSTVVPDANAALLIGEPEPTAATNDGLIDEVKIYNRALSPAEVRTLGFMPGAYLPALGSRAPPSTGILSAVCYSLKLLVSPSRRLPAWPGALPCP
jgi:concanavalin A-like lectin/glucanase superfamily protein